MLLGESDQDAGVDVLVGSLGLRVEEAVGDLLESLVEFLDLQRKQRFLKASSLKSSFFFLLKQFK